MSWSTSFTCSIESIPTAALVAPLYTTAGHADDEQRTAFKHAVNAAVIAASAIGPASAQVQVILGGHANPNNEVSANWSRDTISIQIARL